jgi:hypothetical protein
MDRRYFEPRAISGAGLLVLVLAAVLAGCSGQKPFGRLFGGAAESAEPAGTESEPTAYYAKVDGLKLYAEPRFSSTVVAVLPRGQLVYRYAVERGFARVTVDGSRQQGWVDNAQLIWRLPAPRAATPDRRDAAPPPDRPVELEQAPAPEIPAAAAPGEPAAAEAPTAPPEAARPQPAAAGAAAKPPAAPTATPAVDPALFDPF